MTKAKKVKLPFVVEPKREPIKELIGSEESGQFELLRRGYLTVAEKSFVQQSLGGDSPVFALHRLAGKVAKKHKVDPQVIIDLFTSGELSDPMFEGFADEMGAVVNAMQAHEARRRLAAATSLLLYRLDSNWDVEDTLGLHPDLLEGVFALYLKEEIGSLEGFEPDPSMQEEQESGGK